MLRFSANLTMLFNEVPFLERFDLAANAGKGAEFKDPFSHRKEDVVAALRRGTPAPSPSAVAGSSRRGAGA